LVDDPSRVPWRTAALFFLVAFALYGFTAQRDLPLVDSGELATACATGSVPHPPGFPLFWLLGRLFCAISPLPAFRTMNLSSAFFMALSAGFLFLLVDRMLVVAAALAPGSARNEALARGDRRIAAAAVAALAYTTARNPWTWAGVTEVYALNAALLSAAWMCAWAGAAQITRKLDGRRFLITAAILSALGLANHHATALVAFPPLLVLGLLVAPRILRARWFLLAFVLSVAGALALYLTLIPAGRSMRGLDWGGIRNVSLLIRHIVGRQYQVQFGSDAAGAKMVAREFWSALFTDVGIPAALILIVGIPLAISAWRGGKAARPLLLFLVTAIVANMVLSVLYVVGPEDRIAYDLPAHLTWCAAGGLGMWGLLAKLDRGSTQRAMTLAAIAAVIVVAWNGTRNFTICNFRNEHIARTFVEETLASVPDDSVVFIAEWNFGSPYYAMHDLEAYRPQVKIIDVLMMRRFWYLGTIEREMPDLVAQSRPEFDAFRDQVTRFDLGQPYDQAHIQGLYENLLRKWCQIAHAKGGAYIDWACALKAEEQGWVQSMSTAPYDLLIRVVDPAPAGNPAALRGAQVPVSRMDATNLARVRSKIPDDAQRADLRKFIPRHIQYWKVMCAYRNAVEGSMLYALLQGDMPEAERLKQSYSEWYPNITPAYESALRRARVVQ
jgi:hypothetical protein